MTTETTFHTWIDGTRCTADRGGKSRWLRFECGDVRTGKQVATCFLTAEDVARLIAELTMIQVEEASRVKEMADVA